LFVVQWSIFLGSAFLLAEGQNMFEPLVWLWKIVFCTSLFKFTADDLPRDSYAEFLNDEGKFRTTYR
jgi:3-deoxy-D-manno-octulosonic-acid transferase